MGRKQTKKRQRGGANFLTDGLSKITETAKSAVSSATSALGISKPEHSESQSRSIGSSMSNESQSSENQSNESENSISETGSVDPLNSPVGDLLQKNEEEDNKEKTQGFSLASFFGTGESSNTIKKKIEDFGKTLEENTTMLLEKRHEYSEALNSLKDKIDKIQQKIEAEGPLLPFESTSDYSLGSEPSESGSGSSQSDLSDMSPNLAGMSNASMGLEPPPSQENTLGSLEPENNMSPPPEMGASMSAAPELGASMSPTLSSPSTSMSPAPDMGASLTAPDMGASPTAPDMGASLSMSPTSNISPTLGSASPLAETQVSDSSLFGQNSDTNLMGVSEEKKNDVISGGKTYRRGMKRRKRTRRRSRRSGR